MIRWNYGKFLIANSRALIFNNVVPVQKRWKENEVKITEGNINITTTLIQDGFHVSEVPIVIKKITDPFNPVVKKTNRKQHIKSFRNADLFALIHKEFMKCANLTDVVTMLARTTRLTPNIAAGAIDRMVTLRAYPLCKIDKALDETDLDNLLTTCVNTVLKCENAYTIVNCLKTIPPHYTEYRRALCNAVLEKIADHDITVLQLCDVVEGFRQNVSFLKHCIDADQLWFGFYEMENSITAKEIARCYQVVHYLKSCRQMTIRVLERRLEILWSQLTFKDILDILKSIDKNSISTLRTLDYVGRWLSTSIHTLKDKELYDVVDILSRVKFSDNNIEKSLERFVKAKGVNIEMPMLVVAILNHCMQFRLRNVSILNGCAQYLLTHTKDIEPVLVRPLFYPFAWLNYNPSQVYKFWEQFERFFSEKFHRMNKEDILDVMLGCLYIEKHPLNFVDQVFNHNFLERINTLPRSDVLRNKMKFLDAALTIECKTYKGPLLPKDYGAKSLWQDGRISRMIKSLRDDVLQDIAGGAECFSTNVVIPGLYTTELYLVDIMFHPKGLRNSILNSKLSIDRNINTAVVIHLPEHYCAEGDTLIGPQALRIKHFKILGLKVVQLNYDTVSKLLVHKKDLRGHLVERLKAAESWDVE